MNSFKKNITVNNQEYEVEVTDTAGQDGMCVFLTLLFRHVQLTVKHFSLLQMFTKINQQNSTTNKQHTQTNERHTEYEAIRKECIKEYNAFMIVYDLSNSNSLFDVQKYIRDIERTKDGEVFALVICGNKSDLHSKNLGRANEIPDSVHEFVSRYSCPHFFTSAKERSNVNESFEAMIGEIEKLEERRLVVRQCRSNGEDGEDGGADSGGGGGGDGKQRQNGSFCSIL